MNPQSERDRSIERLLRESLATSPTTPEAGSCLDAEMLAAWVEGGLVGGQLVAAQEHVAGCSACQATLAALVRTTPTESAPEPWWRRTLSARWLVPVAATATALAIWMVVPREEFMQPPTPVPTAADQAAALFIERSGAPSVSSEAPAPPTGNAPDVAGDSGLRRTERQPSDFAARKAAPTDSTVERRDAAPPPLQRPAAEPTVGALASPALESAPVREEAAPTSVGRAAASAPAPESPAPAEADRFSTVQESVTVQFQFTIASPGTAFRWRIGPAGSVEVSTDAGTTWELRPTGVDADLTAGASPGGTVCWVVGRRGTVLLTTDGRQWRRVMFPVATDLAAVQAIDARSATVTAADGRRFRTVDGGATWEGL